MEKSIYTREYEILLALMRDERVRNGVTQVELAAFLGEEQSWISKVERGERRIDVVELRAWCQGLGVNFISLMRQFEKQAKSSKRK